MKLRKNINRYWNTNKNKSKIIKAKKFFLNKASGKSLSGKI